MAKFSTTHYITSHEYKVCNVVISASWHLKVLGPFFLLCSLPNVKSRVPSSWFNLLLNVRNHVFVTPKFRVLSFTFHSPSQVLSSEFNLPLNERQGPLLSCSHSFLSSNLNLLWSQVPRSEFKRNGLLPLLYVGSKVHTQAFEFQVQHVT